ncbi:hypothetical protein QDW22_gp65 [Microbacterium Phage DirtyBubble]|uniref:hypothetical protein n=1 Tax=Microbacterium Phage DirtyBubble TaxID=2590932 RepID=UPI00118C580D|nr:hypothetical protein QDW22_gp65 [Microbacterium Phage DirtyBubble]QDP45083.1 hypothetical protein DIRTYBUBBLE_65 [Microbacterium Phage DirtyBubble]
MTIITSIPKQAAGTKAVPFKLILPRQLEPEQARPIWEALEGHGKVVLADPFALPGVSTVFPGVLYARSGTSLANGLKQVAAVVDALQEDHSEALADGWVELWVTDSMTDAVEVEV